MLCNKLLQGIQIYCKHQRSHSFWTCYTTDGIYGGRFVSGRLDLSGYTNEHIIDAYQVLVDRREIILSFRHRIHRDVAVVARPIELCTARELVNSWGF